MNLRLLICSAAFLLACPPAARAADKLQVRQHWEPGKVYHFESSIDWEITLKPANEVSLSAVLRFDIAVRKGTGPERKLAEVKFTNVKALMNSGGAVDTYDSDNLAASSPAMQKDFGMMTGQSFTLVYDGEDNFVEAILPKDFTVGADDPHQFVARFREDFELGVPKEGLAVGEVFSLDKVAGANPTGPIVSKLQGRLDSLVNHEGRKHARIVMEGGTAMTDEQGGVSLQSGMKVDEEILFDLERRSVTRHTRKESSHRPPGNEVSKTERVTTLKSMEDVAE